MQDRVGELVWVSASEAEQDDVTFEECVVPYDGALGWVIGRNDDVAGPEHPMWIVDFLWGGCQGLFWSEEICSIDNGYWSHGMRERTP